MKRLFTLLIAGISSLSMLIAQVPVNVVGDMKIADGAHVVSKGTVYSNVSQTGTNARIFNKGTLNLSGGLVFVSDDNTDGILLNEGTVTFSSTCAVEVRKEIASDAKMIYISFPFDVKLSDIKSADGKYSYTAKNIFIQRYNSQNRAQYGFNGVGNDQKTWQWLDMLATPPEKLNAGECYGVSVSKNISEPTITVVFPAADATTKGNIYDNNTHHQSKDLVFYTHPDNPFTENKGWNPLGSMMTTNFYLTETHLDGFVNPLYVFNGADWIYVSTEYDDVSISPFTAMFAHIGNNTPTSKNTIKFLATGREQFGTDHFRSSDNSRTASFVELGLNAKGQELDMLRVIIDESYDQHFKLGEDAVKIFPTSTNNSQFYTIVDEIPVIANKTIFSNEEIPVGLQVKEEGEYTINMNRIIGYENTSILLIDKLLNKEIDLKNVEYTFTSSVEETNSRFALRFTNEYTNINEELNNLIKVYAVNENLFIENISVGDQIQIYTVSVTMIKADIASSENISYALKDKGVLLVKIIGDTNHIAKVLMK